MSVFLLSTAVIICSPSCASPTQPTLRVAMIKLPFATMAMFACALASSRRAVARGFSLASVPASLAASTASISRLPAFLRHSRSATTGMANGFSKNSNNCLLSRSLRASESESTCASITALRSLAVKNTEDFITKMEITHPAYEILAKDVVDEYGYYCTLYRHKKSGAELLSVATDDDNKVFGITFRTPPSDSTGVPHILEHSGKPRFGNRPLSEALPCCQIFAFPSSRLSNFVESYFELNAAFLGIHATS